MKRSKKTLQQRNSKRGKLASTALESNTTTSEGAEISKVLSTLTAEEQQRFAAYRRCSLPAQKVSKFVATSLISNSKYLDQTRKLGQDLNGQHGTKKNKSNHFDSHSPPPLKDLVAPKSANDIVVTVATLGKIYAQRLVKEAFKLQNQTSSSAGGPLKPEHILQAVDSGRMGQLFMESALPRHSDKLYNMAQVIKDTASVIDDSDVNK